VKPPSNGYQRQEAVDLGRIRGCPSRLSRIYYQSRAMGPTRTETERRECSTVGNMVEAARRAAEAEVSMFLTILQHSGDSRQILTRLGPPYRSRLAHSLMPAASTASTTLRGRGSEQQVSSRSHPSDPASASKPKKTTTNPQTFHVRGSALLPLKLTNDQPCEQPCRPKTGAPPITLWWTKSRE